MSEPKKGDDVGAGSATVSDALLGEDPAAVRGLPSDVRVAMERSSPLLDDMARAGLFGDTTRRLTFQLDNRRRVVDDGFSVYCEGDVGSPHERVDFEPIRNVATPGVTAIIADGMRARDNPAKVRGRINGEEIDAEIRNTPNTHLRLEYRCDVCNFTLPLRDDAGFRRLIDQLDTIMAKGITELSLRTIADRIRATR